MRKPRSGNYFSFEMNSNGASLSHSLFKAFTNYKIPTSLIPNPSLFSLSSSSL